MFKSKKDLNKTMKKSIKRTGFFHKKKGKQLVGIKYKKSISFGSNKVSRVLKQKFGSRQKKKKIHTQIKLLYVLKIHKINMVVQLKIMQYHQK